MRSIMRSWVILGILALLLSISASTAHAQKGGPGGGGGGGGGGGSGGGTQPVLPSIVGAYGGWQPGVFNLFVYHFNFKPNFTYTLTETDTTTGAITASFAGTFTTGPGPLGFFTLTLFQQGKPIMQFNGTYGVEIAILETPTLTLFLSKEVP
jgi:hypothetical protein